MQYCPTVVAMCWFSLCLLLSSGSISVRDQGEVVTGEPVTAHSLHRRPSRFEVGRRAPLTELAEIGRRRADLVGDRLQRREIESEDFGGREAEHATRLVDRDVEERLLQPVERVGPGAFGVREV